jgi:protein-tyrosine phosphatase
MAEGLMSAALPKHAVVSAGLGALVGHPADPIARALMKECGLSIDTHRACQVNLDMCQRADLILVMDAAQRRDIERRYPFTVGRVFRLCESTGQDVPDPYRAGDSAFRHAFDLIENGVQQWVRRISRVSS